MTVYAIARNWPDESRNTYEQETIKLFSSEEKAEDFLGTQGDDSQECYQMHDPTAEEYGWASFWILPKLEIIKMEVE